MKTENKPKKKKKEKLEPKIVEEVFLDQFKLKDFIYKQFLKEIEKYKLNN